MPRGTTRTHAVVFRRRLLAWFRRHGRDLPWRRTRDPYHIAVSEFMLQQTQVSRVVGYYDRFLRRYPTIESLASASPSTVRESWEGLGYYRRAANLQRLAQTVVGELNGRIPSDPEELRRLPGVGRYTAGAIAAFAFQRATAAVDTNVARVLQRVFHPRLRGAGASRRLWSTAQHILPRKGMAAWSFNQALMELGALVCTAREARCGICPVRQVCKSGRTGKVGMTEKREKKSGAGKRRTSDSALPPRREQ